MDRIKKWIQNDKVKGTIAIIAAIVTYYTPDSIDLIIETLLGIFGIEKLVIKNK